MKLLSPELPVKTFGAKNNNNDTFFHICDKNNNHELLEFVIKKLSGFHQSGKKETMNLKNNDGISVANIISKIKLNNLNQIQNILAPNSVTASYNSIKLAKECELEQNSNYRIR